MNIDRTSAGLAEVLFNELDDLASGKSTPQQARAKTSVVGTICTVSRLEMDYARFVSSERGGDNGLKSISMGLVADPKKK